MLFTFPYVLLVKLLILNYLFSVSFFLTLLCIRLEIIICSGLALLKTQSQLPKSYEGSLEASVERIQDAAVFHPFAEAAYTVL